jgi:hypothetical protein
MEGSDGREYNEAQNADAQDGGQNCREAGHCAARGHRQLGAEDAAGALSSQHFAKLSRGRARSAALSLL